MVVLRDFNPPSTPPDRFCPLRCVQRITHFNPHNLDDAAAGFRDDGEDAARTAIGGEGVGVGVGAGFSVPVAAAAAGAGAAAVFPDAHEA